MDDRDGEGGEEPQLLQWTSICCSIGPRLMHSSMMLLYGGVFEATNEERTQRREPACLTDKHQSSHFHPSLNTTTSLPQDTRWHSDFVLCHLPL